MTHRCLLGPNLRLSQVVGLVEGEEILGIGRNAALQLVHPPPAPTRQPNFVFGRSTYLSSPMAARLVLQC